MKLELPYVGCYKIQYADTPMDFVDACLVTMTEVKRDCRLLTLDSDFQIYRRFGRQAISLIVPAKQVKLAPVLHCEVPRERTPCNAAVEHAIVEMVQGQ